jgi:uroporphyrinogen decarboxylase
MDKFASCGADVIGLDWTMNLGQIKKMIGNKVALQ